MRMRSSTAAMPGKRAEHEKELFAKWTSHDAQAVSSAPDWVQQLILAADQFIVKRSLAEEADGRSIIAGYHWFGDWGRDTMIAQPVITRDDGSPIRLLRQTPFHNEL